MIVFSSTNILANIQSQDDKLINEFATILKQKVLLTSDQETKVINILSDLQKNIKLKPENKQDISKRC